MIKILTRAFIAVLLSALHIMVAAQPVIKEYKGRYVNGISHPAEAEYEYYENRITGEHIIHGRFKYSVRDTDREEKIQQNIRGYYKDGYKDGNWSYRTSLRDYDRDDNGVFFTGNVSLLAAYDNGLPNGRWEYSMNMKSRSEVTQGGVTKWSRYTPTRKISIILNFDHGMLVDSVKLTDSHGTSVYGIFDKQGFFHQDWVFITDTTEEINGYNHGVQLMHSFRNLSAERFEEYEEMSSNRDKQVKLEAALSQAGSSLRNLPFSSDTSTVISHKSSRINTLILDRIYSNRDFMHRYVKGDKLYRFDDSRKVYKAFVKGAYIVDFNVRLTATEQAKLSHVQSLVSDVEELAHRTRLVSQGRELPPQLRNSIKIVNYNKEVAGAYGFLARKVAAAGDVAAGIMDAHSSRYYDTVSASVSDEMSKVQAFEAISHELLELRNASKGYYEQIRTYKK